MTKALEKFAGFFTPPACREEVLGDLHERNASSAAYCSDALGTIPLVILSRIRRTTDSQLVTLYAGAVYLCYWASAWFGQRELIQHTSGLLHLAIPPALVLLGVLFEDAYAQSGRRQPQHLVRGPLIGVALAFLAEAGLLMWHAPFALPVTILVYGGVLGLLLTSALRLLFSPQSTSPQGPQTR
jgi:hypothetical protein